MLTEKMQKALNSQLNAELYSSYLYLAMHAYFKSVSLDGFANWMYYQAQEELMHSMKFYDFITQRNGKVQLMEVKAPPANWDSPLAVFEATLEHEQKVTGLINDLVDIALEQRDHATQIFLQWFVSEQVEEEESVSGVLEKLKLMGEAQSGLFMMDRELAKRKPSAASGEGNSQ
jgi:ferritin